MNLKELVNIVSAETDVPAAQTRKVLLAALHQFSELIESQSKFISPHVTFTALTAPAKPATGERPPRPEQKFARMVVRSPQTTNNLAQ